MAERPLRVMQSFRAPRPTTNPYITMLDEALRADGRVEHVRFSWRRAIIGGVDAFHFHWPETLLEADAPWKRVIRRVQMRALLLRARIGHKAIIRTAHNLEIPQDVPPATHRLLERVEARTNHRIVLNETTRVSGPTTLIPHGHYRDWFASAPKAERVPGRLGYFGLIRRYKGVEALLEAFHDATQQDSSISLRIGGRPSSSELESLVRDAAKNSLSISATLRFLDDDELVDIATSSQIVVLPYRFMHNSGSALAALSVNRPVLVPRNEVNTLLAAEVGEQWVHQFDGELDAADLLAALATPVPHGAPDLSRRDWHHAGDAHISAYRAAVQSARGRK